MENTRPMFLEMPIKINGYDIDVMGIVSNIVYVRWFEDLRHFYLDTYWPYKEMLKSNLSPILSKTEVEYKYPLTIQDEITGRIWVHEFGRGKWIMAMEIATEQKVVCRGKQTGYIFDMERNRPVPIPEGLRAKYEAALLKENKAVSKD